MFVTVSRSTPLTSATSDPIHLVTQFFLSTDSTRLAELRLALRFNVENPHVDTVTLLNERIYTADELGLESPKITQVVIGSRLRFNDVWAMRKPGYTVLTNADIFVDATIARIRQSDLHARRAMYALLRYEHPSGKLFGPRADSQDTWIVHSSLELTSAELNAFKFELGRPGCDNKVAYLFAAMGVEIYNDPALIHTHHCHASPGRSYPEKVDAPYLFVCPANLPCTIYGNPLSDIRSMIQTYDFFSCNARLPFFLTSHPFVIPRIAGIENNTALAGVLGRPLHDRLRSVMKINAGIHLTTAASVKAYSVAYLKPFHQCRVYASWEPWGNYFPHIAESQVYMQRTFPKSQVGAFVFDIFHYLRHPWTHALRGRRLLIVSPFVDMIQTQPPAYHTNLFPDCTFVYVKPPQTHGNEPSRDWTLEFTELCAAVDAVEFDVALCSCGGYGNPLCGYLFSKGKSAIYVGGVLQMYFGIYGGRWIKERKDILTMHLTPDWKRPTVKPEGHAAIESSCYW
jgi:hypothetical protein